MKVVHDSRRFGGKWVLYELDAEHKEIMTTNFKYFITDGTLGLFGNNSKHLVASIKVMEGTT